MSRNRNAPFGIENRPGVDPVEQRRGELEGVHCGACHEWAEDCTCTRGPR